MADEKKDDAPAPDPETEEVKPELKFEPGELAPWADSPYPPAELSTEEENHIKELCRKVGNSDIAARRWEVEQAWEARLFDRGYQYLVYRRGGGWLVPDSAVGYAAVTGRQGWTSRSGLETNIYNTYGEIISSALTRDIPSVRFRAMNPESDADITAKDGATEYAKIFRNQNNLKELHSQIAYYMRTDGRVILVTDHVLDAQRFGREEEKGQTPAVPENESAGPQPVIYLVRHGETELNKEGKLRGRSETDIDEVGERQADRAADFLKDKGIKRLISSPVGRAMDSAREISEELKLPIEADDRFASLDIGNLAGQEAKDTHADIEEYFENPDEEIPGGESPKAFLKRVQDGLFAILQTGNGPVAIVTHDSDISAIFRIFNGDNIPTSALVEAGGVAAVTPNGEGTFSVESVFPYIRPAPASGEERGRPRGQEVVTPFGKLEAKVPMNAKNLPDFLWVQVCEEHDVNYLKAMYPEHADDIKPGGSTSGENELDRIARINSCLALEASYVTGDSMVRDCTWARRWFRPAFFMEVKNKEIRESLFQKFPDGMLAVMVGEELVMARNECMDDHLTLIQPFPGSGQNRLAMCSKLLSLQKRLNDWIDLLDMYFKRCVAMRHVDSDAYDVQALQDQANYPGDFIPFKQEAGNPKDVSQLIYVEPTPQPQPTMPDFILQFANQFPQLLSGALPSLFGADSNMDAAIGVAMQRDQALGRLATPWGAILMAACSYFKQAVELSAQCRQGPITGTDGDGKLIRVQLSDLKGNVLAYPEQDANFPETWNQRQARYQQLLQDSTNPLVMKLLSTPANLRIAHDAFGIQDFEIPEADSYEKQMGEFEILLKTSPIPNPEKQQLQTAVQQMQEQMRGLQAQGQIVPPESLEAFQQAQQQLQALPDNVSSVPVDKFADRHEVEKAACIDWMNKPEGRRFRDGSEQEKAAFENVKLHAQEHDALIPPPAEPMKPPSTSIAFRDLPPDAASALLKRQGLPAEPADVITNKEFGAEIEKAKKVHGGGSMLPPGGVTQ